MDVKAIGLVIFYGVSLPSLAALWCYCRACRREGREAFWFFSALSRVLPILLVLVPLILYAEDVVAGMLLMLVVLSAVAMRVWAGFSFFTNGSIRPFRYRADRRIDTFADTDLLKEEERQRKGQLAPPHL